MQRTPYRKSLDHIDQAAELSERLEMLRMNFRTSFYLSRSDTEDLNPAELDAINERIHDIDELRKDGGQILRMSWSGKKKRSSSLKI